MAVRDMLTGDWLTTIPSDRWVIVCDSDGEYVAARQTHPEVMTHGCREPAIRHATGWAEVVRIVRAWIDTHDTDYQDDCRRVAACRAANDELRQQRAAEDLAIRRCVLRGSDPCDVTVHEVAIARRDMGQ